MYFRLLILCLFFSLSLYSNTLQRSYTFSNPIITSDDLNATCSKNFEIVRIPDGKTSYRMNAQIVLRTFELNSCALEGKEVKYINFTKKSNVNYDALYEQVNTFFISHYPNLKIQSLQIHPHGYLDALPVNPVIIFDKDGYLKNKGVFYIINDEGLRRYFDYSLDATLSCLHTSQKVTRKDPLSLNNCTLKEIPFTSFRGKPLLAISTDHRFRASLASDSLITDRQIEPKPIVLRNSKVSVQVRSDAVVVEFMATATQEGALYDIITIEKADKKRVRAKIIGENSVELQ
jgi:flagella basal body P-ring formation protein FlgA